MFARFSPNFTKIGFPVHRALQSLGAVLALAGFFVAVSFTSDFGGGECESTKTRRKCFLKLENATHSMDIKGYLVLYMYGCTVLRSVRVFYSTFTGAPTCIAARSMTSLFHGARGVSPVRPKGWSYLSVAVAVASL